VGVEKANIISTKPSVEEGTAETLNIHMCLSPQEFLNAPDAGATGYFWPFQNICELWLLRLREKNICTWHRM
jgi:hypothetical protein